MKKNEKTIVNQPYIIHVIEDGELDKKFRGICKCQPSDEWNEENGKRMAKLKAEIKRENYKKRQLISEYNFYERAVANEQKQIIQRVDAIETKIYKKNEELFVLSNGGIN